MAFKLFLGLLIKNQNLITGYIILFYNYLCKISFICNFVYKSRKFPFNYSLVKIGKSPV